MIAPNPPRGAVAALLTLAFALALALRLAPLAADPGGTFTSDQAFHARMIAETIARGRVPDPDRLSEPPEAPIEARGPGRRAGRGAGGREARCGAGPST